MPVHRDTTQWRHITKIQSAKSNILKRNLRNESMNHIIITSSVTICESVYFICSFWRTLFSLFSFGDTSEIIAFMLLFAPLISRFCLPSKNREIRGMQILRVLQ